VAHDFKAAGEKEVRPMERRSFSSLSWTNVLRTLSCMEVVRVPICTHVRIS
jgi:hypothetical protein